MRKIFFVVAAILIVSCNNQTCSTHDEAFTEFNQKFHTDSLFQMSRIKFPIGGNKVDGWEKRETWDLKNWEMLKSPVSKKNAFKEYQHQASFSDTLVTEKYWIQDSGFSTEVRFKKADGKWFLVYFNDVNL